MLYEHFSILVTKEGLFTTNNFLEHQQTAFLSPIFLFAEELVYSTVHTVV
jgi:hypothetical protein